MRAWAAVRARRASHRTRPRARRPLVVLAVAAAVAMWATSASAGHINSVVIDGSINPVSSAHIQEVIKTSEGDGAVAVLIELDTPGGLVSATKDIIQAMLNAEVPIIVFVSPRGAWAASAGTYITLAAHVAAMAPGTTIGAASPVSGTGGGSGGRGEEDERSDVSLEKAEQVLMAFIESIAKERGRNVEWAIDAVRKAEAIPADEALELNVIDLIAQDRADLLRQVDGREVSVAGKSVVLDTEAVVVHVIEMSFITSVFNFLSSPDVAILLAMAGLLGLYVEFNNPGLMVPGIAGLVCLVLAGIAFQILPFDWVGLLLIVVGMGLIVAEAFTPAFGALFVSGIVCFLVGGSMVFDMPEVSDLSVSFWPVLVPISVAFAIVSGIVVFAVGRSNFREQTAGVSELVGLVGKTTTALDPEGKVFVRGEYWTAQSTEEIAAGQAVEVTEVEGMRLRVRRATSEA